MRQKTDNLLEKEDLEKIGTFYREWIEGRKCSICNESEWYGKGNVFTGTTFHLGRDRHIFDKVDARIKFSCGNCGYVMEFDAARAGILTRSGEKRVAKEKSGDE